MSASAHLLLSNDQLMSFFFFLPKKVLCYTEIFPGTACALYSLGNYLLREDPVKS